MSDYDVILLDYPIWYSHIPNIVITQLEKLDLNGKTIYPFNTHLGSGTGNSINEIKSYATNANVKDGFPINMNDISNRNSSKEKIKNWLEQIIGEKNNKSIYQKINHYLFYIICILLY